MRIDELGLLLDVSGVQCRMRLITFFELDQLLELVLMQRLDRGICPAVAELLTVACIIINRIGLVAAEERRLAVGDVTYHGYLDLPWPGRCCIIIRFLLLTRRVDGL